MKDFSKDQAIICQALIGPSTNDNVLFDMDSTLIDFVGGVIRGMQEKYGFELQRSKIDTYIIAHSYPGHARFIEDVIKSKGFYSSLEPYPNAIDAVRLTEQAGFNPIFLTMSYRSPYLFEEKCAWVTKYFGSDWLKRLIITHDKTDWQGRMLIDDRPRLSEEQGPWLLVYYDQPYNRDWNAPRISNWQEYIEVMKETKACKGKLSVLKRILTYFP